MFIGIYLIMVNDPQILFNDGFYPLLHVVMPEGSLLRPRYPAALGCRTHALARLFDVLGGALCKQAPELNTAAGYGTSPYMLYSGWDGQGEFFYSMEILYGGIPGRPIGDGMDGHSWWPLFENIPTEYLEAYYPLRIDGYTTVTDSGGAGLHRGGNGVEKRYVYLEPGEVSIHDDRWLTRPWGVLGGLPGGRSEKILQRADGTEERLSSKCDKVVVEPGDMLVYRTAGGGGWKDRLDRPVEAVVRDVSFGLVSRENALAGYGVVVADDGTADEAATEAERARQRAERGEAPSFDFGPSLEDVLANCKAETGLEPPTPARPLRWSPLEPSDRRARAGPGGRRDPSALVSPSRRVRGEAGRRPAPCPPRDRHEPRLHEPGVAAALRSRRRGAGDRAAARRGAGAQALPVVYTTVSYGEGDRAVAKAFVDKVPALLALDGGQPLHGDRPADRATAARAGPQQALRVGVLRHAAAEPTRRAGLRLGDRDRRVHLRVRSRDRGRRAPERLPARPSRARRSATATAPRTSRRSTTSMRSTATSSRSTRRSRDPAS